MPTYEYKCTSCEEIFERFQRVSDPPMTECPVCGSEVKKIISGGVGIIFKGSGFYTTDYKNSSHAVKSPSEAASSGESSKAKDDSKGADKTKDSAKTSSG